MRLPPDCRQLDWPKMRNVRDLGGLPCIDGHLTAEHVIIRSDTPARLTPVGLERALRHPVRTVIDLRERRLAEAQPNPLRDQPTVAYHHLPLLADDFPLPVVRGGYRAALAAAQPRMASVCRALVAAEKPALIHCHSGTGRTGLMTVVLLELAGVRTEAIIGDFHASLGAGHSEEWEVPGELLDQLRGQHDGVKAYLAAAGLDAVEIASVARLFHPPTRPIDQ